MADRENVKIVISAALIVIVASMGIYAFIYRDKISEMLPNWQGKGKSSERMILGDEKNGMDDSSNSNLATAEEDRDLPSYKMDAEAKEYPEIPNLPQKESDTTNSEKSKIEDRESKMTDSSKLSNDSSSSSSSSSSIASLKENPIPPEMSDKSATVYKPDPKLESKPSSLSSQSNQESKTSNQVKSSTDNKSKTIVKPKQITKSNSTSKSQVSTKTKSQTLSKPKIQGATFNLT